MKKETLFDTVKKHWYLFCMYIIMSYIITQVVVDGSNRIAKITDRLFTGEPIVLGSIIVPFLYLTIVGTIAAFIKSYTQNTFSVKVQVGVKTMIIKKLVRMQYGYFDATGTGSIMNKVVSDVYQIEALFSGVIPEFMMGIVTIVTVGIYICIMDYRLFLVTIVCYPLLLWIANVLSKKMGKLTGNRRELYDNLQNTALDTYNGMIVGRTYNLNHIMKKRVDNVVEAILANEYIRTRISSISLVLGNIIRWIPMVICYLFALYEVFSNKISVGSLLAFAILLDRIVHPFGEIPGYINAIREQWVSFKRLDEIIAKPEEESGEGEFVSTKDEPIIKLEHIDFSYQVDHQIFNDLNLTIQKGKHTAFVGLLVEESLLFFEFFADFMYLRRAGISFTGMILKNGIFKS